MAPPPSDLSRAISTGNYRLAKQLARQFRFMVSEWSKQTVILNDEPLSTKMLPLHQAVGDPDASFRCIQVLLQLYPAAAYKPDSTGKLLPLHWACQAGASLSVIELLLEHYPEAVAIPDAQGRLPLHYSVMQRKHFTRRRPSNFKHDSAKSLATNSPEQSTGEFASEVTTSAAANVCSSRTLQAEDGLDGNSLIILQTVQCLLHCDPSIARGQDRCGHTPLVIACRQGAPFAIIKALIEAYPEACLIHSPQNPLVVCQETSKWGKAIYKDDEEARKILVLIQDTQQSLRSRVPNLHTSSSLVGGGSSVGDMVLV